MGLSLSEQCVKCSAVSVRKIGLLPYKCSVPSIRCFASVPPQCFMLGVGFKYFKKTH